MKRKYYPNNFDAIRKAPDEFFEPCSYEEFFEWRMCMWEMPSSIECIMRVEHKVTGKITEHVYQQRHAFEKRLMKYVAGGEHNIVVANHDSIAMIKPTYESDTD